VSQTLSLPESKILAGLKRKTIKKDEQPGLSEAEEVSERTWLF
jgi:hypothetical protein